ncbi:Abi family protein [Vibrio metschnikovii]
MPLWVVAEAWDFGALSKFYSILSGNNQDLICNRLGLDNRKELDNWLINLNGIRNRCTHHARLCNRSNPRTLQTPMKGYFNLLDLSQNQKNKFFGLITVIWFLLKQIGPSSTWICRIADLIDQKHRNSRFYLQINGIT